MPNNYIYNWSSAKTDIPTSIKNGDVDVQITEGYLDLQVYLLQLYIIGSLIKSLLERSIVDGRT